MSPELAWSRVGDEHCLRLTGWSARQRALLTHLDDHELAARIVVLPTALAGAPGGENRTALATSRLTPAPGRFTSDGDGVTFVPRFPFLAGTSYTVLVHPALCEPLEATEPVDVAEYRRFTVDARGSARPPSTSVLAIHPSTGTVPRNLLRCYVQFSAPMSEGDAPSCVHLVDIATGEPIAGAFLDMDPELWDPARTRLTVLLDPARIKRGLTPHREAGYALHEGRQISLVVDAAFRDADGLPLVDGATRTYRVGRDVRGRVDPVTWDVTAPRAGSRAPVRVAFGRPLDHALVARCVRVDDSSGTPLAGRAMVTDDDASLAFTPDAPWRPVRHEIVVDAMLEDVAGNSVVRVFDRDLADVTHTPVEATHVTRDFTPA